MSSPVTSDGIPVVAVLLAGGAGSRFAPENGGHKLDAVLRSTSTEPAESVIERAVRHVSIAAIGPVIIVVGGWSPDTALRARLIAADRKIVVNDAWREGQITSVHAGLAGAGELGATRVVIGLGDQPFVSPDAWRTVAAGPGPICVATYGGRRGNPVALDREMWSLLPETGDEGARGLMRIRPDLVREVSCSGSPADIDTAEDLHRWQNN
jgi:molybdenum cofactor cytidylyltransferase